MEVDLSNIVEVKVRIKDIQLELGSHKISRNRQYRMNTKGAEPTELNTRRQELSQELLILEKHLATINTETKKKRDTNPDVIWRDCMHELMIEVIGKTEFKKFIAECINRTKGLEPKKVILDYGNNQQDKNEIKRLSKIATDLKETLVSARKQVDRHIRQNEPEVNKADYHNKVRELITCMPPEKDIFKIKVTPNN